MSQRVTLEDIARKSGASPATVSLALRNKPGVSPVTRARIQAVARSLGYTRPARTDTAAADVRNVALIFRTTDSGPERAAPALNRFYSWILAGIQDAADEMRMNLVLGSIPVNENNSPSELPPDRLFRNAADGILLVGAFREETIDEVVDLAGRRATPVVLVDGASATHRLDSVGSMNRDGVAEATRYLLGLGHSRIAFAGRTPMNDPNFEARYQGYATVMADEGLIPENLPMARESVSLGAFEGKDLPFTAVVCGNDHSAWLLVRELQRIGKRVPDDVSVVGFDDTDHSRDSIPPITTMAVDMRSMGRIAVRLLDFRLEFPEAAPITALLSPRLVERTSARAWTGADGAGTASPA
jgi:LacI family transcriptional regulator